MAPVVLFDGVCGLCDGWVQFLLRRDRAGTFQFAPLQSEAGGRLLREHGFPRAYADSIILVIDGRVYRESTAVLQILRRLGGAWSLCAGALAVPRLIRDLVYRQIARHRYRWFGKLEHCRLPAEHERSRFLAS